MEVVLTVRLPDELMARVNLFALDSGDIGKAAAVRELLGRGLAAEANPTRARSRAPRSAAAVPIGRSRSARKLPAESQAERAKGRSAAAAPSREVTPMFKKEK